MGYKTHAASLGYKQILACAWQLSNVITRLQKILQERGKGGDVPAAMPARDGFIAMLWQTACRGCNARAWLLGNVNVSHRGQAMKQAAVV